MSFFEPEISPWKLTNLAFLIPLMGWMPCPVELCVWPSLWMFSRAKDSNYKPNIKFQCGGRFQEPVQFNGLVSLDSPGLASTGVDRAASSDCIGLDCTEMGLT